MNRYHHTLLKRSIATLKPNFHCFAITFYNQLTRQPLSLQYPSGEQINERSYLLYCALERTIMHLDTPPNVIPFIEHHANILAKLKLAEQDVPTLCSAFMTTLKIHLGRDFSQAEQQAWQYVMRFFNSVVSRYLFSQTNVIAIRDRTAHLHSC
ncbi:MAG: globin [Pseudoalteromonas sp.]